MKYFPVALSLLATVFWAEMGHALQCKAQKQGTTFGFAEGLSIDESGSYLGSSLAFKRYRIVHQDATVEVTAASNAELQDIVQVKAYLKHATYDDPAGMMDTKYNEVPVLTQDVREPLQVGVPMDLLIKMGPEQNVHFSYLQPNYQIQVTLKKKDGTEVNCDYFGGFDIMSYRESISATPGSRLLSQPFNPDEIKQIESAVSRAEREAFGWKMPKRSVGSHKTAQSHIDSLVERARAVYRHLQPSRADQAQESVDINSLMLMARLNHLFSIKNSAVSMWTTGRAIPSNTRFPWMHSDRIYDQTPLEFAKYRVYRPQGYLKRLSELHDWHYNTRQPFTISLVSPQLL